ncbi:MAG: hypothetical protein AAF713_11730 [Pseudomonadota bacterium]
MNTLVRDIVAGDPDLNRSTSAPIVRPRPSRPLSDGLREAIGADTGDVAVLPMAMEAAWTEALTRNLMPGQTLVLIGLVDESPLADLARRLELNVEAFPAERDGSRSFADLAKRLGADAEDAVAAVAVICPEDGATSAALISGTRILLDHAWHGAKLFVEDRGLIGAAAFAMDAWGVDLVCADSGTVDCLPAGMTVVGERQSIPRH